MTFNISERYLFAINLLLAALVIPYLAARAVSAMVKLHYASSIITQPTAHVAPGSSADSTASRTRAAHDIIKQRDVFNLALAPEVAPVEHEDLNITLLGTSHLTGGAHEFAIVEDQAGNPQLYRLGETIPNVGRLSRLERIARLSNTMAIKWRSRFPRTHSASPEATTKMRTSRGARTDCGRRPSFAIR